jgi:amino-acid N-acetyltransferase
MRAPKARASDAPEIFELIARYAAQGQLLSCVGLESYGADLAEIRSLAVAEDLQGRGLGARLIEYALEEARRRDIPRVFAVTHAPNFFLRQGFTTVSRQTLTEKIERDCRVCPKRRSCRLTAIVVTLLPERDVFPVLNDSSVFAATQ